MYALLFLNWLVIIFLTSFFDFQLFTLFNLTTSSFLPFLFSSFFFFFFFFFILSFFLSFFHSFFLSFFLSSSAIPTPFYRTWITIYLLRGLCELLRSLSAREECPFHRRRFERKNRELCFLPFVVFVDVIVVLGSC